MFGKQFIEKYILAFGLATTLNFMDEIHSRKKVKDRCAAASSTNESHGALIKVPAAFQYDNTGSS